MIPKDNLLRSPNSGSRALHNFVFQNIHVESMVTILEMKRTSASFWVSENFSQKTHNTDGRNPKQPPGMYKTL